MRFEHQKICLKLIFTVDLIWQEYNQTLTKIQERQFKSPKRFRVPQSCK